MRTRALIFIAVFLLPLAGCKREERKFASDAPSSDVRETLRLTELQPGMEDSAHEPFRQAVPQQQEDRAWDLSEGKMLYSSLNCNTCHAHGGGDIGPPLADDTWLYGSQPLQVYASIMQGRPNGMPSFSGKITEDQAWKLAAYVRSMSGQAGKNAAPGRDDHLGMGDPENSRKKKTPKQSETKTGTEQTK